MDDNDTKKMIGELTPLAEGGNASAQHALGLIYYLGIAEDTEFKEATKWLKMSASQGNIDSQHYLGLIFIQSDNYEEAYIWTSLAAENGSAEAQLNLAVMFFNGSGTDKDIDKAIKWATLAAEQGDAQAQCNLAKMYLSLEDETVYQDAIKWFKLSSEQDNAEAQCKLALMYENGQGTEKDYDEAFSLYSLSANQGYADAQYFLGQLFENGLGVEQNLREAYRLYVLAAEQGDEEAKERIIEIESIDPDIKHDTIMNIPDKGAEEITIKLLKEASEKGIAQSQYLLGVAYLTGTGVDIDYKTAQELLTSAAEQNHSNAQYNMGVIHANGLGVEVDLDKAYMWFKRSAELCNDDAREAINRLIEAGYEIRNEEVSTNWMYAEDNRFLDSKENNAVERADNDDEDMRLSEDEADLSDYEEFIVYLQELHQDPTNLRLRYKFVQYLMEMINSYHADYRDDWLGVFLRSYEENLKYIIAEATIQNKLLNFMKLICLMQLGMLYVLRGQFFEAVKTYYKIIEFKWRFNKKTTHLHETCAPDDLREIYAFAAYNIHSIATRFGVGEKTSKLYSQCFDIIDNKIKFSIDYHKKRINNADDLMKQVHKRSLKESNALLKLGTAIYSYYFYDIDDLNEVYVEDPDESEYDIFNTASITVLIDDDVVNGRFSLEYLPINLDDQISRIKIYV